MPIKQIYVQCTNTKRKIRGQSAGEIIGYESFAFGPTGP